MNNAVVIGGLGTTGKETRLALGIKNYFDLKRSNLTLKEIAKQCRYVFLALPTPTVNGVCQTKDIFKAIQQIHQLGGKEKVYIIRSTVIPGTCRKMMKKLNINSIVHNPEFLTETTWKKDAKNPDIIVIGADNQKFGKEVKELYKARFKGAEIILTDTITSEMIKYAINCFYATKVIYANQIYDLCQKTGADYEKVKKAMYKRKWIGENHLTVFYKGKRGVGGKCLRKDVEAFARYSGLPLLKLVKKINDKI